MKIKPTRTSSQLMVAVVKQLPVLFMSILAFGACKNTEIKNVQSETDKPIVSLTFDDGITSDLAGYTFEDWNNRILTSLEEANLKTIFYVTGSNKTDKKGQYLLRTWNEKGHGIGNHTYTHPFLGSEKNTTALFETELLQTDSVISKYDNAVHLFRFPYLNEGNTREKTDSLRAVLKKHDYHNGYVTIDASDWYINSRLIKRINEKGPDENEIEQFRKFYLSHILDRAAYYEKLSFELNNRHIKHTLLLHHNLSSALFVGDLINKFKEEGWEVIDAGEAYKDSIFQNTPLPENAGQSLIWSLAKQSGKYEGSLRYPGEGSEYEEAKMDSLGL